MEKVFTTSLTLDDIVFENRNRAYGAYDLRTSYEQNMIRALILAPVLLVFFIGTPLLVNNLLKLLMPQQTVINEALGGPVAPTIWDDDDFIIIPEKPPIGPPAPPSNTVRYVPFEPVPDHTIRESDEPTTAAMLENAVAGPITVEGTGDEVPPLDIIDGTEGGTGLSMETVAEPENVIFTAVEQMPEFPGGQAALMKFISKQLRYPRSAVDKGISGVVYVGFVINAQGKVTQVEVLKGIDQACDEEAVRVISKLPDWKPGRQSGRNVSVRYSFPIRFAMQQ